VAYTLNDYFRSLRLVLRINGLVIGLLLGLFLFFVPRSTVAAGGLGEIGPAWPLRMTGAVLIGFGLMLLYASRERIIPMFALFTTTVTHALLALVFLLTYLEREYVQPSLANIILLVFLFVLTLVGAVAPLRFIRTDYPQM